MLVMVGLPIIFTTTSFLVARALGVSASWTFQVCLGCLMACFIGGSIAFLIAVFATMYSAF